MSNYKQYEVSIALHSHVSEENVYQIIHAMLHGLEAKDIKASNSGRYDMVVKEICYKVNIYTIYLSLSTESAVKLKTKIKKTKEVINFMILRKEKDSHALINYKNPIEIKKHLFESMRIMPIEITRLTKRKQKYLTKHIKRARVFGLISPLLSKGK